MKMLPLSLDNSLNKTYYTSNDMDLVYNHLFLSFLVFLLKYSVLLFFILHFTDHLYHGIRVQMSWERAEKINDWGEV